MLSVLLCLSQSYLIALQKKDCKPPPVFRNRRHSPKKEFWDFLFSKFLYIEKGFPFLLNHKEKSSLFERIDEIARLRQTYSVKRTKIPELPESGPVIKDKALFRYRNSRR